MGFPQSLAPSEYSTQERLWEGLAHVLTMGGGWPLPWPGGRTWQWHDACSSGSCTCLRIALPARQAELDVIREKLPRNNKGAEGIGTSYVTCRTQCTNKHVGSLFKSGDKFQDGDSRP